MQTDIVTLDQFNEFITNNKAATIYLSTPDCNVCKILKPKLIELLDKEFPEIKFGYVNVSDAKDVAAQQNVFSVPTILFCFDGKEYLRKARFINLDELSNELERIYSAFFS